MQQLRLEAKIRESTGKGASRDCRRRGIIPGILYGLQKDSIPLQIDERRLHAIVGAGGFESALINLELDDMGTETVMIKDVQHDPVSRKILHADFLRISLEKEITTPVSITLLGTPLGVRTSGGVQEFAHRELEIRCLPTAIPENIELDITEMLIGDHIRVSDISLGEIEILDEPQTTIVTISPPRVAVAAPSEEVEETEEEEPEVITRRRKEEEEAG